MNLFLSSHVQCSPMHGHDENCCCRDSWEGWRRAERCKSRPFWHIIVDELKQVPGAKLLFLPKIGRVLEGHFWQRPILA
jgi:hypothetical protein